MRKVFALFLILILFCGCGTAELGYEITRDNRLIIENYIRLEHQAMDAGGRQLLEDTLEYWQSLGLTVYPGINENELGGRLSMHANNSRHLESLVESSLSGNRGPFKNVRFRRSDSFFYESYTLQLELDLSQLLAEETVAQLPAEERELLGQREEWLDAMELNVRFTLPGNYVSGNATGVSSSAEKVTLNWAVGPGSNHLQATTRVWTVSRRAMEIIVLGGFLVLVLIVGVIFRRKRPAGDTNADKIKEGD